MKTLINLLLIVFVSFSCRKLEDFSSSSSTPSLVLRVDTAKPLFLFRPPFNRFDSNFRVAAPNSLIGECRYYRSYRDSFKIHWPYLIPMLDSVFNPTVPTAWMKSSSQYWDSFDSIPERMVIHVDTVSPISYLADPFGFYTSPVSPKLYLSNYYSGPFGSYPYKKDTVMGYYIKFPVLIVPNRSYSRGYVNLPQCKIEVLELRLNRWQALHEYATRNFNLYVVRGFDPTYNINVYRDQQNKAFPYFLTRF